VYHRRAVSRAHNARRRDHVRSVTRTSRRRREGRNDEGGLDQRSGYARMEKAREGERMIRPMGSRILVKDIITTLSVEKRAENAGLVAIVSEQEKPKPTSAIVVAIGTDPELQRHIAVGDVVSFGYLDGKKQYIHDEEFRALEFNEIITVD